MDSILRSALRKNVGLRHQLEKNLLGEDGDIWEAELKKFLRKEPSWVTPRKPKNFIKWQGEITISPTTERFIAREKFSMQSGIRFHIESNFEHWFIDQIEEPFGGSILRYGELLRYSMDSLIIHELGGEDKSETSLTEIFTLIAKQPLGEEGILLTNAAATVFYVRAQNVKNALCYVCAEWNLGCYLSANPFDIPGVWPHGGLVFSRK